MRLRFVLYVLLIMFSLGSATACRNGNDQASQNNSGSGTNVLCQDNSNCTVNGGTGSGDNGGTGSNSDPTSAPPEAGQPDPGPAQATSTPTHRVVSHPSPTFADVDLQPLCDSGDCSGTQQVGDTLFAYTDAAQAGDMPNYFKHLAFQGEKTSCRSLTVRFAGDEWAQGDGHPTVDYLKFVQESTAPVYATVAVGEIKTVHVSLDGGPLYIDAAVANDPGVHNSYVLLEVSGSCSTPDGLASN